MSLEAGRLRHRVDIQEPQKTQNATTGEVTTAWTTVYANIPVAIEASSVREFLAARQLQSEISLMIIMRFIPGLKPNMRFVNLVSGEIYTPYGFLPDKDSGREYLTVPCSEGVAEE